MGINSTVILTCTASVSNVVTFVWTYNNRKIKEDIIPNGNTSKLKIVGVDKSNDGRYVCVVSSGSLMTVSNEAFLTVITGMLFFLN